MISRDEKRFYDDIHSIARSLNVIKDILNKRFTVSTPAKNNDLTMDDIMQYRKALGIPEEDDLK